MWNIPPRHQGQRAPRESAGTGPPRAHGALHVLAPHATEGLLGPVGVSWGPLGLLCPGAVRVGLPWRTRAAWAPAPNAHPVLPGQQPWVSLPPSAPPGKYPQSNPSLPCDRIRPLRLKTCLVHLVSVLPSCVGVSRSQVDEVWGQSPVSAIQPGPPPARPLWGEAAPTHRRGPGARKERALMVGAAGGDCPPRTRPSGRASM